MWKMIAALATLIFIALSIIANSGDPTSAPVIRGSHGESASAMRPAEPMTASKSVAADTGAAAEIAQVKMSTRRTTVINNAFAP